MIKDEFKKHEQELLLTLAKAVKKFSDETGLIPSVSFQIDESRTENGEWKESVIATV